jgi:hypothetical protein
MYVYSLNIIPNPLSGLPFSILYSNLNIPNPSPTKLSSKGISVTILSVSV